MKKNKSNTKMVVIAIALGLLIVISGVQATELVSLKNKLGREITTLTATSEKSTISTNGKTGSLSKNLKDLPGMVGGC